jgi:hypothetical protein
MKRALFLIALLGVALLLWFSLSRRAAPVESARPPVPVTSSRPAAATPVAPAASATERSTLADALNSPTKDIRADLQVVAEVISAFRSNFPRLGNPVGTNAEITAALTGKNKLHLALIPADHPAINRDGELCDRWGTPFFFHAESSTRMEIRSAGPDKKMWTDDDVAFAP